MFVHTIVLPGGLLPMSDDGERRLFSPLFFLSSARSSLTQISLSTPTTSALFVRRKKKGGEEEFQNEEKGKPMKKKMDIVHAYASIFI
jgi:hypothetical protein